MSQGARRKRNWRENKRREGLTWSQIDGPRSGRGAGGGGGGSHGGGSSNGKRKPRQRTVSKTIQDNFQSLAKLFNRTDDVIFTDDSDVNIVFEETEQITEQDLRSADFLSVPEHILDTKYDKKYDQNDFRGELRGGECYFVPTGYDKLAININDTGLYSGWNVAFHGTTFDNCNSIAEFGLLNPGYCLDNGTCVVKRLGQRGSKSQKTIYVTPSIHYASLYAHPHELTTFGLEKKWIQIVLQVRVRPGCFTKQSGKMRNEVWGSLPIDLRLDYESIEWLIDNKDDVKVYGILCKISTQHPFELCTMRKELIKVELQKFFDFAKETTNIAKWSYNVGTRRNKIWQPYPPTISEQIEREFSEHRERSSPFEIPNVGKFIIFFSLGVHVKEDDPSFWRGVMRTPKLLELDYH